MLIKIKKWIYGFIVTLLSTIIFLAFVTNVPTHLDPEDRVAIKTILQVTAPPAVTSFDDEIRIIRWAQNQVMQAAPGMDPIPNYTDREPMDLLKAQSGLCYDRSRTLDKVYKWLGFETRHVYILFAEHGSSTDLFSFIRFAFSYSNSHAVTEVLTSRGWLLVDSNTPWISLNKKNEPIPAHQLNIKKAEFIHKPDYLDYPYWAIRGMYSRKGQFYRPFITFPEFNWPDLLNWVIHD